MAIFASTTTSGYSDPLKALTIKALEKRQADLLAQQAAEKPDAAMMGTIPGGIGHVLGQVGNSFREMKTDQALAAQKEILAKTVAGIAQNNGEMTPEHQSTLARVAPELLKDYADRQQQTREHRLTREQQVALANQSDTRAREMQKEGFTHTETLAEKTDRRARELAEGTDKRARELQKERLDAEAALEQKKLDAAKATTLADPKRNEAIRASETDYRKGLSHIDNLEEAAKILEHPKGIYTGAAQSTAPIASGIPGVSMFVDKEKAQNTSRFNTIVGEDAIRDMSETLKGSSTNFELNEFKKMKNDPNISDAQRAAQLRKVVKAAKADLEAQAKETQAIGGDTARVDRAMKGGDTAVDPLEGKTATGPNGEQVIRRGGKWVPK